MNLVLTDTFSKSSDRFMTYSTQNGHNYGNVDIIFNETDILHTLINISIFQEGNILHNVLNTQIQLADIVSNFDSKIDSCYQLESPYIRFLKLISGKFFEIFYSDFKVAKIIIILVTLFYSFLAIFLFKKISLNKKK